MKHSKPNSEYDATRLALRNLCDHLGKAEGEKEWMRARDSLRSFRDDGRSLIIIRKMAKNLERWHTPAYTWNPDFDWQRKASKKAAVMLVNLMEKAPSDIVHAFAGELEDLGQEKLITGEREGRLLHAYKAVDLLLDLGKQSGRRKYKPGTAECVSMALRHPEGFRRLAAYKAKQEVLRDMIPWAVEHGEQLELLMEYEAKVRDHHFDIPSAKAKKKGDSRLKDAMLEMHELFDLPGVPKLKPPLNEKDLLLLDVADLRDVLSGADLTATKGARQPTRLGRRVMDKVAVHRGIDIEETKPPAPADSGPKLTLREEALYTAATLIAKNAGMRPRQMGWLLPNQFPEELDPRDVLQNAKDYQSLLVDKLPADQQQEAWKDYVAFFNDMPAQSVEWLLLDNARRVFRLIQPVGAFLRACPPPSLPDTNEASAWQDYTIDRGIWDAQTNDHLQCAAEFPKAYGWMHEQMSFGMMETMANEMPQRFRAILKAQDALLPEGITHHQPLLPLVLLQEDMIALENRLTRSGKSRITLDELLRTPEEDFKQALEQLTVARIESPGREMRDQHWAPVPFAPDYHAALFKLLEDIREKRDIPRARPRGESNSQDGGIHL